MRKYFGVNAYLSLEAADELTVCNLRDSIKFVEKHLAYLQKVEDPSSSQEKEIAEQTNILVHLKAVLKYYGG